MPISQKEAESRMALLGRVSKVDKKDAAKFFKNWLGISVESQSDYWLSNRADEIGKAFRELGFIRRPLFLRALQGKLGPALGKALEAASEIPYQIGDWRVPFRAPNNDELSDWQRGSILLAAFELTQEYDQPASFFAEWIGYIDPASMFARCDLILAGAIDSGDRKSYEILVETIRGKHPVGTICRSTVRALLHCHQPEAWTEIERLLLAAQREEGLRQTIFESIDELNPRVFSRFLRIAIEHNLLRFSSVARAFALWFPGIWKEGDAKSGAKLLGRVIEFLQDKKLAANPDPTDVYLRLWTYAFEDAIFAIQQAGGYLASPDPAIRRSTARILLLCRITSTFPHLKAVLQDPVRTVASIAVEGFMQFDMKTLEQADLVPLLWPVASSWPKAKAPDTATRSDIWDLTFKASPPRYLERFAQVAFELSPRWRVELARLIGQVKDVQKRKEMALLLLGDASEGVRQSALSSLEKSSLTGDDALVIEDLLRRKASDLRKASLRLLRSQNQPDAVESGKRLLASKDRLQRLAGLELLIELGTKDNSSAAYQQVQAFQSETVNLDEQERNLLARIKPSSDQETSLDTGFGLFRIEQLTFCPKPPRTGVSVRTDGAIQFLKSLDVLIHEHRNEEVSFSGWGGEDSANMTISTVGDMARYYNRPLRDAPYENDRRRFPLAYLTEPWMETRPPNTKDPDSQELVRAHLIVKALLFQRSLPRDLGWCDELKSELRYLNVINLALPWILKQYAPQVRVGALLDMLSERVATIVDDKYSETLDSWFREETSWRTEVFVSEMIELLRDNIAASPNTWRDDEIAAAFRILRFIDEPLGLPGRSHVAQLRVEQLTRTGSFDPTISNDPSKRKPITWTIPFRRPCPFSIMDKALLIGACNRFDVSDQLGYWSEYERQWVLRTATSRNQFSAEIRTIVDEYVARLVEIEVKRGELPTPASELILEARSGIYLPQVRLLLSKGVAISSRFHGTSRGAVFSDLLAVSRPRDEETPEICAAAFLEDKIKPDRLLELAMFAPQWSSAVELAVGWEGLSDAIWWIHAHTKDENWGMEAGIKAIWKGQISERTPLSSEDLVQGGVDVAWYNRFRSKFEDSKWARLEAIAKLASSGIGHARAKLFAQAMDGAVSAPELIKRIEDKRTPDAIRALGLIPLEDDSDDDVRRRYGTMQAFLRASRQFGSMRQASEKLAARIGLENLARTAGYPDPLRLTWALEAREVEDLKNGGKTVACGDVQIRLAFDSHGEPQIDVQKGGHVLKDIPAAAKKSPEVKELCERRVELRRQAQRMRLALEQAMQRGDPFEASELRKLMDHPGLAPMLRNLVFIGDTGQAGYLDASGRLEGNSNRLIIAHPYDLLKRGDWPEWQHRIFCEEQIQPFKQVFRELYTLTSEEQAKVRSTRYAGHQLQPRQALAILGKREWVLRAGEGLSKTIHESKLTAHLSFEECFYTPTEIEGLTLEGLRFTHAGTANEVALSDVPPKAFSETMRDLDLIVSVASMMGIDPEASESSIEMRASVVRELALLMRLGNVSLTPRHAIIGGRLGEYTVHLGSGIVHQRAKGELVIVAVRQPQRGRLFLPFMDDDPKTAEIASKVLLLSRDDQMKDPTILTQIVS